MVIYSNKSKNKKNMIDPNKDPISSETAETTVDVVEQVSDSPERRSLVDRLKVPMGRAAARASEIVSGTVAMAVEQAPIVGGVVKEHAERIASGVSDTASKASEKVVSGYEAASEGAQKAWDRRDVVIAPVVEAAGGAYTEIVKPIGGDVLTALGREYGIEYEDKLKIRPVKFGRAALRAFRNPAGAAVTALGIAKKAATSSSVKMFVS
ncbi:MAG: hypothetical protein WCK26_04120 [Candidatus Saccharibacteria bacterium]